MQQKLYNFATNLLFVQVATGTHYDESVWDKDKRTTGLMMRGNTAKQKLPNKEPQDGACS